MMTPVVLALFSPVSIPVSPLLILRPLFMVPSLKTRSPIPYPYGLELLLAGDFDILIFCLGD